MYECFACNVCLHVICLLRAWEVQSRNLSLLELELLMAVSFTQVHGSNFSFSARAGSAANH